MSPGLKAFLTRSDAGLQAAAEGVYVPEGKEPPATFQHNRSHTTALQAFGVLAKPIPADAPLATQLYASMTGVQEPPSKKAPRPLPPVDPAAGGGGGSSGSSGASAASPRRKNSVSAAVAAGSPLGSGAAVSTSGSLSMISPGFYSSSSSPQAFEDAWEAASAAADRDSSSSGKGAGSGASSARSGGRGSSRAAPGGSDEAVSMSMLNPLRGTGAGGGAAKATLGDSTMEWK